jgi:ParB-like chromosome segregation protein Spo0J
MEKDERVGDQNTSPKETQGRVSEKLARKTESAIKKENKILERLKVEKVPVDFLKPNAYNPNRQSERDFELLCKSMSEDGFTQPILALKNGIIIDGEHRWRAARQLGYTEIPCVLVEMSQEQTRISTLRHNRARGSEDVELTSQLLRDLEKLGALEYAKGELMLSEDDVNFLLGDVSAPDNLAGAEYQTAWEPVSSKEIAQGEKDMEVLEGSIRSNATNGTTIIRSYSERAAKNIVALDKELSKAKTPEEVKEVRKTFNVYRISFSFTGKEGQIVASVLGKNCSTALLELCKKAYAQMEVPNGV